MTDPQIVSAIIQSVGAIIATVIAATTAALIGKKFLKQERIQNDLDTAKKDIEFLLVVEKEHCDKHKSNDGTSYKNTLRKIVIENGFEWSGRFTPGRVKNP